MPDPQKLQALILLSLIPIMIGAMYALTQVSEEIRNRWNAGKRTKQA